MSITFRVKSEDETSSVAPAPITVRQFVTFWQFARDHTILVNDLPEGEDITRSFCFDAGICSFALAVLAPLFGNEPYAIAVLDEAQFTQRQVRLFKSDVTGELMLGISNTMDGSIDLDLATGNAITVLSALDIEPTNTGDLPLAVLRDRLADPRVRERFVNTCVEHYLPRLDRLAAITAHEQEPRLVWAEPPPFRPEVRGAPISPGRPPFSCRPGPRSLAANRKQKAVRACGIARGHTPHTLSLIDLLA